MSFKSLLLSVPAIVAMTGTAIAGGISVEDAYARSSGKSAKAGAAFMVIVNETDQDDRLIGVAADISSRAELHTHRESGDGVMQMIHVEEGFEIPAGESHALQRGGDHVMFMGLTQPMEHGDTVPVTLIFERAGEVQVDIPVDLERKPEHGGMKHQTHSGG
ncbi:copper chaperone PCu(A)C [Ruegeria sp. 2012CJ41-6]|uniref:Copper chaperone PCu(A)C n=1 Tax=Ruegeria spongiae TaxID=2942209 RepID=A0ABT0Q2P5_9RHOB|nr:copper chaperone PCu(A)C [Ruegeria spongiae]MCL6283423.1 copper chaperone PCu(A)C [Ruegeria spongiae]